MTFPAAKYSSATARAARACRLQSAATARTASTASSSVENASKPLPLGMSSLKPVSWVTTGFPAVELWPPIGLDGTAIDIRRLQDVPDNRSGSPPFPTDLHNALADGAIGMGMARLDERFDSAAYFDARFSDATQRLRRRRHGRVGKGGTPIRLVT